MPVLDLGVTKLSFQSVTDQHHNEGPSTPVHLCRPRAQPHLTFPQTGHHPGCVSPGRGDHGPVSAPAHPWLGQLPLNATAVRAQTSFSLRCGHSRCLGIPPRRAGPPSNPHVQLAALVSASLGAILVHSTRALENARRLGVFLSCPGDVGLGLGVSGVTHFEWGLQDPPEGPRPARQTERTRLVAQIRRPMGGGGAGGGAGGRPERASSVLG